MRFTLCTNLNLPADRAWNHFDRDLLMALSPPGATLLVHRYEGQQQGDSIEIEVRFWGGLVRQYWKTAITLSRCRCFVDESEYPPAPLKTWRHVHAILPAGPNSCKIVDRIEFKTGSGLLDVLFFLPMYLLFSLRGPQYRSYFGKIVKKGSLKAS